MPPENLKEILELHAKWLRCIPAGKRANLLGANLRGADLLGANLRGANLRGADLLGANLRNANLRTVDLEFANLRNADLDWTNLSGADLLGANLRNANLRNADLDWTNLSGANLLGANLLGANLRGANLLRAAGIIPLGHPDNWTAYAWLCEGRLSIRVGCRERRLDEAREYWFGKPNRREVLAAVEYAAAVAAVRGWAL